MAELFGETFASKDMGSKTPADTIKEEVASYQAASGITVDGDPLTWWKAMSVNTLTLPRWQDAISLCQALQFLPRECSQQQGT